MAYKTIISGDNQNLIDKTKEYLQTNDIQIMEFEILDDNKQNIVSIYVGNKQPKKIDIWIKDAFTKSFHNEIQQVPKIFQDIQGLKYLFIRNIPSNPFTFHIALNDIGKVNSFQNEKDFNKFISSVMELL